MVGRGTVVCGEEQAAGTSAVINRPRKKSVDPVISSANRGTSAVRGEGAGLSGKFKSSGGLNCFSDYVDNGQKGARTIQRGTGSANNLDSLDQVNVEWELGPDLGKIVNVVIETVSVEQQQDLIVVPTWAREPAYANIAVVAIIGNLESTNAAQCICQRPVAELTNLLGSNHGYRRGRFPVALQVHRRAINLYIPQCLRAQVHDVVVLSTRSCGAENRQPQQQWNPTGRRAPEATDLSLPRSRWQPHEFSTGNDFGRPSPFE